MYTGGSGLHKLPLPAPSRGGGTKKRPYPAVAHSTGCRQLYLTCTQPSENPNTIYPPIQYIIQYYTYMYVYVILYKRYICIVMKGVVFLFQCHCVRNKTPDSIHPWAGSKCTSQSIQYLYIHRRETTPSDYSEGIE